ncbi:MAG TPA: SpoIIE family protein phosphatase [Candidatus Angelobacter sp.]|nr:SpoIIE family protein phosphatase [Candidatus Angelobacter sp.]
MSPSSPRDGNRPPLAQERRDLYLGIQAVDVFVRDVEQSVLFYVDQLGFKVVSDVILQSGRRRVGVAPPDGTAVLNLIAPDPESEEFKLIGRPTQVVFVTEDVASKYSEWRKRGVRFRHTPRLRRIKYRQQAAARLSANPEPVPGEQPPVWGGVFTRFEDIDGNSFALVSLDEVSRMIDAERRATAEKQESERRAAHELEIAKEVQLRLFPQTTPLVKTLEYAGVCIQALQVGGDYYDFLSLSRERLGLVLGDISGKGIAAALLMANLQANLRTQYALALDEPVRFLQSVNQLFYENTADNAYASLFFGEYDDRTRRLSYANCGHLSALLLRSGNTLERLDSTCTVLGLFKDWTCSMAECRILAGDILAIYTDGITESLNSAGEEFGEERLIAALRRHHELPPHALLDSIVEEVRRFSPDEQQDDITLIVAKGRD